MLFARHAPPSTHTTPAVSPSRRLPYHLPRSFSRFNALVTVLQSMMHIPSSSLEMKEVLYERLSVPLQFLNVSYLATLKVRHG